MSKIFKKLWINGLILILSIVGVFGLVLPYLFSASSNMAVFIGVVLLIAEITFIVFFIINTLKQIKNK